MTIGILTFLWSTYNYGQILQAYALQKILTEAGHNVYIIRYESNQNSGKKIRLNPFWLYHFIKRPFRAIEEYRYICLTNMHLTRKFGEFIEKKMARSGIIYRSYDDLARTPPVADAYIAGSDQIWNFSDDLPDNLLKERLNVFFLEFSGEEKRRIAFAASFGKTCLSSRQINLITPLIKKFYYVSVREQSGIELCRRCGYDGAEFVPDPALLVKAEQYRLLYREGESVKEEKRPYCLVYMIRKNENISLKRIFHWTKKRKLRMVYVPGSYASGFPKKKWATIAEWLYLVDNSECVITDSFHGTVFSLIFKKNFGVIALDGENKDMNNRIFSLFGLFGIESRMLDNNLTQMDMKMEWNRIDSCFSLLYKKYDRDYLNNNLFSC
jgi:hypothetical protein